MISEFGSPTAMVFVPDAHVKSLLQVSEKTWKMITLLVQTYGQLEYYQYSTSEINNLSIEQRIFRSFCMVSLQGRTFHLLCRRFNRTKQMPCMYFLYYVKCFSYQYLFPVSSTDNFFPPCRFREIFWSLFPVCCGYCSCFKTASCFKWL